MASVSLTGPVDERAILFVACRGFEPLFFDRKVNRPEPLDEHAIYFLFYKDKDNFFIYQIFWKLFYLDLVVYLLSACNREDYCIIRLLTSKPILFYKDKETFSFHQIFFYFFQRTYQTFLICFTKIRRLFHFTKSFSKKGYDFILRDGKRLS